MQSIEQVCQNIHCPEKLGIFTPVSRTIIAAVAVERDYTTLNIDFRNPPGVMWLTGHPFIQIFDKNTDVDGSASINISSGVDFVYSADSMLSDAGIQWESDIPQAVIRTKDGIIPVSRQQLNPSDLDIHFRNIPIDAKAALISIPYPEITLREFYAILRLPPGFNWGELSRFINPSKLVSGADKIRFGFLRKYFSGVNPTRSDIPFDRSLEYKNRISDSNYPGV
jgi:hypothetical protein